MIKVKNAKRRKENELCSNCMSNVQTKRIYISLDGMQSSSFVLCPDCVDVLIHVLEQKSETDKWISTSEQLPENYTNIRIPKEDAKLLGVKDGEEISVFDIYHRRDNYYKVEDANIALMQTEEIPIGDEDGEYSEEEYNALCQEVADIAMDCLEKSDPYWESYWTAFDYAISEIIRKRKESDTE